MVRRTQGHGSATSDPKALRRLSFFQGLSVGEIREVLQAGELREYPDGKEIRSERVSRPVFKECLLWTGTLGL